MQSKSSRVFLLVAIVLGILATVTTFAFLESSTKKDTGPKTTVLVAARDLPANTTLDPEKDLKELQIPEEFKEIAQLALVPERRSSYKGQRLAREIRANWPVLVADLGAAGEFQFTGPQFRALSLPAKNEKGLSGLLVPGDWVKIYSTRTRTTMRERTIRQEDGTEITVPVAEQGEMKTSEVLARPVRVLAVGSRLNRPRQGATAADQYAVITQPDPQQTVTVELTDEEVAKFLDATVGQNVVVTFVLCPPQAAPAPR